MLTDEYRKCWALRYLREAKDEFKIAKKNGKALNLIFDAVRKAQVAIYYSLGEPYFIENIVQEALENPSCIEDPILQCLTEIEKSIRRLEQLENGRRNPDLSEFIIKKSDRIISIADKIVELLIAKD